MENSITVDFESTLEIAPIPHATSIVISGKLTPPQIATAYNIPPGDGANVKVAIISLGGGWKQSDLNLSMNDLGLVPPTINQVLVGNATGTFTGSVPDIENTLDIYCVAGMAPKANITIYIGGGTGFTYATNPTVAANINLTSNFSNVINRALEDNPDIITISWGGPEKINYNGTTFYCGDYLAGPLATAAAKGTAVFVASGDYGSSAIDDLQFTGNIVCVDYPSSNANTISVGGTWLTLGAGNTRAYEYAVTQSGGGVSSVTPRPNWQANSTYQTFNKSTNVTGPATVLSGKGVPDISAPFYNYSMYFNGNIVVANGTSASAPIMAGMIARFIGLQKGRRPRSLNPIFYNNINAFSTLNAANTLLNLIGIVTGNNADLLPDGYKVTDGWDAVVGLGPPNGQPIYKKIYPDTIKIKDTANTWQTVHTIKVKTANISNPWANVTAVWTKTGPTTWTQIY